MRLFPIGWLLTRYNTRAERLGAYTIKAKSNILFSPYMLHHNERYWAQADAFIPERFAEKLTKEQRKAYIPFGGGPRICIGQHLAMLESKIALALLGQRFDFNLKDGFTPEKDFSPSLKGKQGMWLSFSPRVPGTMKKTDALIKVKHTMLCFC